MTNSPIATLTPKALTRENFAPYGDVIESDGAKHFTINEGSTERYHDLADVDVADEGGRSLINIFVAQTLTYPRQVKMMERHPLGSQAFIPLDNRPFLVLVAKHSGNDTLINPADLKLFHATGQQGINYHKNTWHHPILALEQTSRFLIVDRGGDGDNCVEYYLPAGDVVMMDTIIK